MKFIFNQHQNSASRFIYNLEAGAQESIQGKLNTVEAQNADQTMQQINAFMNNFGQRMKDNPAAVQAANRYLINAFSKLEPGNNIDAQINILVRQDFTGHLRQLAQNPESAQKYLEANPDLVQKASGETSTPQLKALFKDTPNGYRFTTSDYAPMEEALAQLGDANPAERNKLVAMVIRNMNTENPSTPQQVANMANNTRERLQSQPKNT